MSATDVAIEHARVVVRRALEAADNGNQAGEDAVVVMASAGSLKLTLASLLHLYDEGAGADDDFGERLQTALNAGWSALAQAEGEGG